MAGALSTDIGYAGDRRLMDALVTARLFAASLSGIPNLFERLVAAYYGHTSAYETGCS